MRKALLLLILIVAIQFVQAQHWQLFVENQKSYYQQNIDNSMKVEEYLMDSTQNVGEKKILFFNSKSNLSRDCSLNIKLELAKYSLNEKSNKIDSIISRGDSILYMNSSISKSDTFIFKPYAGINDYWITNSIQIKCVSASVKKLFGIDDSIKVFKCIGLNDDTLKFVLSKNFGLLKFIPFNDLLNKKKGVEISNYIDLIGYKRLNSSKGYVQPDFSDYFHLTKGDILFWLEESDPLDWNIPGKHILYVDTVTYAYISKDSVYYDYSQTIYEKGLIHKNKYSSCHLRKKEGLILSNSTSWFGINPMDLPSNEIFYYNPLTILIDKKDTITNASYELFGLFLNKEDCSIGQASDYFRSEGYSTREGLIYTGSYYWSSHSTHLIGSIINGSKKGITEIPTGININEKVKISIFPNPVKDLLEIDMPNNLLIKKIELLDINGNLLFTSNFSKTINVNNLKSGFYILRLIDAQNHFIHCSMIKE